MSCRGKKRKNRPPQAGGAGRSEGPMRVGQGSQDAKNDEEEQDPQRLAAAFERELVWCIQQLELGLTAASSKPEGRQAEEAMKILKILQNPKAPMVKKRQAMRNTFGDYRKKMAEEERKHATNMKKMKLEAVHGDTKVKATFLKRASTPGGSTSNVTSSGGNDVRSSAGGDVTSLMSKLSFQGGDTGFKFNFTPKEEEGKGENVEGEKGDQQNESGDAPSENIPAPNTNYFKMTTSDNSFRFGFSVPESS